MRLPALLRTALAVACAAGFSVCAAIPAGAAQAGMHQWWSYPSSGLWNLDTDVTVLATGPTRFFSHEFYLEGGDTGYLGIQDTPNGKVAIFSMWNSPGDAGAGPGAKCETFGGEGVGWHCMVPFSWSNNVKYRLRVWLVDSRSDGSTKWVGSVQDTTSGQEQVIGYLWTRAGQKNLTNSVSWIEDYGMTTGNCATEVPAKAIFSYPTGNNDAVHATRGGYDTAHCGDHYATITDNGNGTLTLAE